ncbi:alpha/beta hydrolase [Roseovarius sp. SCSIO 43702]|nr:alpha/beta hydrolase [Roseovarius sp. SCSIO 43702]
MTDRVRAAAPGDILTLPRGKTHYRWHGPEGGQVIVCIHGLTTASYVWGPIAEELAARGYRVLTYDHYGRGYSDRPRGDQDPAFFRDHLDHLLDALAVEKPVVLLGYSLGGAVAADYAAHRPARVRELALLAPAGLGHDLGPAARLVANHRRLGQWLMHLTYPRSFRAATRAERDLEQSSIPGIVDLQLRELDYRGFVPAVWSSLHHTLDHDLDTEHRAVAEARIPTLAIWAAEDDIIPVAGADRLASLNPAARNVIIPGAGHALAYTHTDRVLGALDRLETRP